MVEYFDPFGLIMPYEIRIYLLGSEKKIYSQDEIQNRETVLCGYWCLYYLNERQKGKSILDVIHNNAFDEESGKFYLITKLMKFLLIMIYVMIWVKIKVNVIKKW